MKNLIYNSTSQYFSFQCYNHKFAMYKYCSMQNNIALFNDGQEVIMCLFKAQLTW